MTYLHDSVDTTDPPLSATQDPSTQDARTPTSQANPSPPSSPSQDTDAPRPRDSPSRVTSPPPEPEYTIRKIVRGRYRNGRPEYLIHWQVYSTRDRTWEPFENLNAPAHDYVTKHPIKMTGQPPAP